MLHLTENTCDLTENTCDLTENTCAGQDIRAKSGEEAVSSGSVCKHPDLQRSCIMEPVLPYDILYLILANVLGDFIHRCLVEINGIPPIRKGEWDAISSLRRVSRMFRDIVGTLVESVFRHPSQSFDSVPRQAVWSMARLLIRKGDVYSPDEPYLQLARPSNTTVPFTPLSKAYKSYFAA
ncbi:hypothetical protein SERLA73DRAFT_162203, partial [Serpula lacrymans var. lacrymans S7.3]